MGPPSVKSLLWYLEKSFEKPHWSKCNVDICDGLPWNRDTIMLVLTYIFRFISNLDEHSEFTDAAVIIALEEIATFLHDEIKRIEKEQFFPKPTHEIVIKHVDLSEMLLSTFFPDVVPRFFTVPKIHHLNQSDQHHLHPNEIIAAFIDFLLQVLFYQTNIGEAEVQQWSLVRKELSFLLALLGDMPFQCTHHHLEFVQQTNILLAEFEVLANVAGSIVYDAVFSNHPVEANEFLAKTLAWSEGIELLNAKIIQHCIKFSELPMSAISRTSVVDSYFIILSLIEDIDNLKNHSLNVIDDDDDIMEQMRTLHNELTLSGRFIKVVQDNEEKEVLVEIRDLTYEAEYLINSLVVGNIQVWYLKIRLPSVIQKIKLASFWLQQISDRKLMKLSFPTTGNVSTVDDNHFLDFNLDRTQRILKNESKKISEVIYEHLPPEIKPCFLYFAAFPNDSEISKEKLTWLWIAEGLIPKQGNKSLEDTAEMYLMYLIGRNLVLIAKRGSNGAIKRCRLQSVLHEFCARKANEENFIKFTNGFSMYEKCQRLCVASPELCNYWRPFGLHCRSYRDLRPQQKSSCFQTMTLLKVVDQLAAEEYSGPALSFPAQLRYLGVVDLSDEMVANVVNLEFIFVRGRYKKDYNIPSVVLRMVKLKHMLFEGDKAAKFEEDCSSSNILTTTNLRTLSGVCINGNKDEDILKRWSPHLHELNCRVTDNVTRFPDVSFLTELESLKISYGYYVTANISSSPFNFPSAIKRLCLCRGRLPWEKMSIIGRLPNLHDLKLKENAFWGEVWETRDGEFQNLKFLKLQYIPLRVWMSCSEHFPVLLRLVVEDCKELCDIPSDFRNIPTLQMVRVIKSSDHAYLSALALQIGKQIQVYLDEDNKLNIGKRDELVQKHRNGYKRELMDVLSWMEEYYDKAGGSQQGFINKLEESESGSEYSRRNLRIIDQTVDKTTTKNDDGEQLFFYNQQTYFVVISFAMQFSSDLQKQALRDKIMGLHCIIQSYHKRKQIIRGHPRYVDEIKKTRRVFSDVLVNSFIPQLQGYFQVPKIEKLSDHKGDKHLNKNEILAGYMDFLLQILLSEFTTGSPEAQQFALLHNEISFHRALMGDIPFQPTTDHPEFGNQVNSLLAEFEMLSNEVGGFLFSIVFPIQPINGRRFHAETNALLGVAKILNAKIEEHCINFSKLPMSAIVRSSVVDSFFIVDSLADDLQSIIMNDQLGNFTRDDSTKEQMRQLHGELTLSLTLLRNNESNVKKEALIQIRDLAYEAEYLINSLGVGSIHVWYLNLRLPSIISKIKIACIGLQQISETKSASEVKVSFPITGYTAATIDANQILDFNDETSRRILNELTRKSITSRQFISIFGMPGLGKTTTTSKLYNGKEASNHFDRRAWCVVSEKYNVRGLLEQIWVGVGNPEVALEVNDAKLGEKIHKTLIAPGKKDAKLGEEIHKTLYGRRYLIILDDVWHPEVLDILIRYFPDNGNGSRIIITTRNKNVSPSGGILYELPFLSKDQCWKLLEKKVFPDGPCPSHLVNIGKRIAARCSGVPLAVITIAGVLVNVEKEESEWERVEKRLSTILLDDQSDYRKIMDLSYHRLPHNIKPCFLSFAGYPEDAEISKKELIRFWIAQGFIPKDGDKSPESIAEMYLLDLINRSLVMIAKRAPGGAIKTCRIHDLLLDLCIKQADEDNFLNSTNLFCIYDKHQHLYHPSSPNSNWRPFGLHCRSLRCHVDRSSGIRTMALLKGMVLFGEVYGSSDDHPVVDLPCQLRYLSIIGRFIISKIILDNLVDLKFFHVRADEVVHIPPVVLRMAKLRHLSVRDELKFEEDSNNSISERTNLRSLLLVVIRTKKDEEILRNSPHLQTLKCIIEGEEVPDLSRHAELESLRMNFMYSIENVEIKFLPSTIKKLCLNGCCLPWEKISIIGQLPKLEVLKLEDSAFVGEEWETKDDEFKELRYLKIESWDLKYLSSESCDFPSLECLVLCRCHHLVEIPSDLGSIPTLMEIRLEYCGKEACLSGIYIEQEQRQFGNQELQISLLDCEIRLEYCGKG